MISHWIWSSHDSNWRPCSIFALMIIDDEMFPFSGQWMEEVKNTQPITCHLAPLNLVLSVFLKVWRSQISSVLILWKEKPHKRLNTSKPWTHMFPAAFFLAVIYPLVIQKVQKAFIYVPQCCLHYFKTIVLPKLIICWKSASSQ